MPGRSRVLLIGVSLALLPALPLAARASVVVPLGLAELVGHAEHVAVARVEREESRWTRDHGAIYTDVTLRVLQTMKGPARAGDTLVVRREGGVVDGIGMRVSGAATFAVGEELVVFAERRGAALWTVGMAQGKIRIAVVDGRRMAVRQTIGLALLGNGAAAAPPEPAIRPLDELLADIAARVGSAR